MMIEFEQVCRSYGDRVAVENLNLKVAGGELYALLGHNGAGKTTAIRMLVGLLRPDHGAVRVGGFDVVRQTREAAGLVGFVPDAPFLYDKLSGREILQFIARMYGMDSRQTNRAIDREIVRFELAEFIDSLTESYSHGMKQRTVFASALLHAPKVLVVDEPMVGLDPHSMRLVKDLLKQEVAAGMCVLMSTHTLTAAEEIANRIGIMSHSHLVFDGTLAELRQKFSDDDLTLESMYLSVTQQDSNSHPAPTVLAGAASNRGHE